MPDPIVRFLLLAGDDGTGVITEHPLWVALAVLMIVGSIGMLVWSERRARRLRRQLMIKLPTLPPRETDSTPSPVSPHRNELYPGMSNNALITMCPMVAGPDSELPLRDWLRHHAGADVWSIAVSRFYQRAAADPDIAAYFRNVDMEQLAG